VNYDPAILNQSELLAALEAAGCLRAAAVRSSAAPREAASGGGVADLFGKALLEAMAQRTATRILGVFL
jgi:hypothetical protein